MYKTNISRMYFSNEHSFLDCGAIKRHDDISGCSYTWRLMTRGREERKSISWSQLLSQVANRGSSYALDIKLSVDRIPSPFAAIHPSVSRERAIPRRARDTIN